MKCPRCDRDNSEERKTCMYCGESLDSEAPSEKVTAIYDESTTYVEKETVKETKVEAFPDTVEMNVMDISHNEPLEETTHKESRITEIASDENDFVENQAAMTLERAMSLLRGFKESFDKDHLKSAEYDRLVFEVIKDYIMPTGDKEKINFIANGIKESAFNEFLNGDILQELRRFVIEYVASK